MPMVVEAVRHVELEAGRVRQHHAAAGMHGVDLLTEAHGVLDVQQPERVFVGDKQDAFILTHAQSRVESLTRPATKSKWLPDGA